MRDILCKINIDNLNNKEAIFNGNKVSVINNNFEINI